MFGGGGGGLNPRKMQQMMKQMGIDVEDLDVEEVVIRTADEDLVFTDVDVTRMDARGQQTYQVVGKPDVRSRSDVEGDTDQTTATEVSDAEEIPDSDVEIVAERAGVSEEEAREALEAENGDLAAAISRLE